MGYFPKCSWRLQLSLALLVVAAVPFIAAQPGGGEKKDFDPKGFDPKGFDPKGFDPKGFDKKGFGFGPMGPPMNQQRKIVGQFDKDGDGRLNAEERQAARESLRKNGGAGGFGIGKKGPGFGPPGGGPGWRGTMGPGMFLGKPLLEALDSNQDGKVTSAELSQGAKTFFQRADPGKKGKIAEPELAEAITAIFPAPPGFGGPGKGPGGPGFGPGAMLAPNVLKRADANRDGKLTEAELTGAAESLLKELDQAKTGSLDEKAIATAINQFFPEPKFGPGGPGGGPGGFGKNREPAKPGPKVAVEDAKTYPDQKLYDPTVLRTFFIEFENKKDWEAELADFYHTDVEVPATVIVDGKRYANVGVHFRGNSSYFGTPQGYKHSFHLAFDFIEKKQNVMGYRTLNFLNCASDPTLIHSVLFCNLSRKYTPAPQANWVKVVVNGESWGIFANQQPFNKEFVQENYQSTKGARWKVPGHPGADNGLRYLGDDISAYKTHYEIKSADNEKDWKALVKLCKILNQTPVDQLEAALKPMLDLDGVLWFLAMDIASINDDGYWTRASDYNIYRDPKGVFHISAHDTNETFQPVGFGPGGFGGPKDGFGPFGKGPKDDGPGKGFGREKGEGRKMDAGSGLYALDPLMGMNDTRAPLRSKLLTVPSLREKYLRNVKKIAEEAFDWKTLQPTIATYRKLLEKEVEMDTRKPMPLADFQAALSDNAPTGPGSRYNLRAFMDGRRSYLLNHPAIKGLEAGK